MPNRYGILICDNMQMSVDNENKDDDREGVIKRGLGKQAKK